MGIKVDLEKMHRLFAVACAPAARAQSSITDKKAVIRPREVQLVRRLCGSMQENQALRYRKTRRPGSRTLSAYKNVAVFIEQHERRSGGRILRNAGEGRTGGQLEKKLIAVLWDRMQEPPATWVKDGRTGWAPGSRSSLLSGSKRSGRSSSEFGRDSRILCSSPPPPTVLNQVAGGCLHADPRSTAISFSPSCPPVSSTRRAFRRIRPPLRRRAVL